MKLVMPCIKCGNAVNYAAMACQSCGKSHPTERESDNSWYALQLLFLSLGFGGFLAGQGYATAAQLLLIGGPSLSVAWFVVHREYSRWLRARVFTVNLYDDPETLHKIQKINFDDDPSSVGEVGTMFDNISRKQKLGKPQPEYHLSTQLGSASGGDWHADKTRAVVSDTGDEPDLINLNDTKYFI